MDNEESGPFPELERCPHCMGLGYKTGTRLAPIDVRDKIVEIMSGGGVDSEHHADALERADEIIDLIVRRVEDQWNEL